MGVDSEGVGSRVEVEGVGVAGSTVFQGEGFKVEEGAVVVVKGSSSSLSIFKLSILSCTSFSVAAASSSFLTFSFGGPVRI